MRESMDDRGKPQPKGQDRHKPGKLNGQQWAAEGPIYVIHTGNTTREQG
jgi:hypothetical protein